MAYYFPRNYWNHAKFFVKKKPLVFPRVFKGYFKGIILRQKVLRTIDWSPTYRCNANCVMCSARSLNNPDRKELTLDERKAVWKQARKLGVIHTQFTGGEPMVMGIDWLCHAIRDLNPKSTLISMTTNGLLLSEEKLDKLKEAGLDTIQVSLMSFDAEKHRKRMGIQKSNASQLLELMKYAQGIGLSVCTNMVFGKNNLNDLNERIKFAGENNFFIALNPVSNPGTWTADEYQMLEESDKEWYHNLFRKYPFVRADTVLNFRGKSGCPSGERIYITAYGDVMGCPHLHISFGNVLEEPLKVIWKRLCTLPLYGGTRDYCRWLFDKEYYKRYMEKYADIKQKPISWKEVWPELVGD